MLKSGLISLLVLVSLALPARAEVSVQEAQSIARIYTAAFDRFPKDGGLNFWISTYSSGSTIAEIAAQFADSPEFETKYGELTDRGFVEQLFRNVLGREGAQGGIGFWINTLASGNSRGYVLSQFSDSPENREKTLEIFSGIQLGPDGDWVFVQNADSPEGLWIGGTSNDRSIQALVLGDGTFYVIYSAQNNPLELAGVVLGTYSASGSTFRSTDAIDYNLEDSDTFAATISATFTDQNAFGGGISYGDGESYSFTSLYSNAYDLTPSLAQVAGSFSGSVASSSGSESAGLTIAGDGSITGTSSSGCRFTGLIYAKTSGNVFNLSVSFEGSPCLFAFQTFDGVAYYDQATRTLYTAAPNIQRTDGVLFVGRKSS